MNYNQDYSNTYQNQSQLEQQRKLDHLKSQSQVKILNATIDGKETERKQIAEIQKQKEQRAATSRAAICPMETSRANGPSSR